MKNIVIMWVFPIIFSYLIGTIPIGLIISKILKDDIRNHGSGNIGSTNMTRTYGKKYGKITFVFDVIKAIVVYYVSVHLLKLTGYNSIIVQSFVTIGHSWNIFLKMSGGKGVACALGLSFMNYPLMSLFPIVLWWIIFFATRIVSICSILSYSLSSIIFIILCFTIKLWVPYMVLTLISTIIIIIRHKDNISRLLKGEEYSFKK